MRASSAFFFLLAGLALLSGAMAVHAGLHRASTERQRQSSAAWVRRLDLTDLCLFTEARYTRHPAMADRHAAFQDHPSALDHFPSGSLLKPPSFPSPHASAPATPPKHP